MYKNNSILAIIPARSGSRGIKNKNLVKINNLSLVAHAINCVKKINFIDHIHVSTDGKKIFNEASKFKCKPLFLRTKKLSGPRISDIEVIEYVLKKLEKILNKKFQIILLIQPTSPLRKSSDLLNCIKLLLSKNADSVWSLSISDLKHHPLKQLKILKNKLSYYDKKGNKIIARQQLNQVYHRNGICYALRRNTVLKKKSLMGTISIPYIVKRIVPNIDSYKDLEIAKKLMRR